MATNESQYYQPGMYQSIENAYQARAHRGKAKKAHTAKAKATKATKAKQGHLYAPVHARRSSVHHFHAADPYKKAAKHARVAHAAKGKG